MITNGQVCPLIQHLFPTLKGRWGCLDLNREAKEGFPAELHPQNPLLDPVACDNWVRGTHIYHGLDYSWGGYMEDRSHLWRGHYHDPGEMVHLGIDYNVPAGTPVAAPAYCKVAYVQRDPDQNGGWGGRVILEHRGRYLILAHLAHAGLPMQGQTLGPGHRVGTVGEISENGGWFPHLHAQAMHSPNPDADGYASPKKASEFTFPHPAYWADLWPTF